MEQLTTTQVAEELGVTVRRVQAMIKSGLLRGAKVGRDYLIARKDLDKLPRDRKPGPKPKKK